MYDSDMAARPSPKPPRRRKSTPSRKAKQVRRTVTIPVELDREAHDLVGNRAFSALVTRGLERELQAQRIDALLQEYEEEHGPLTYDEIEAARRKVLGE